MRVCLKVGSEQVFAYCEGQPGAGDVLVLPGDSFTPHRDKDVEVEITTLHPTWRSDDDGTLVASFDAKER